MRLTVHALAALALCLLAAGCDDNAPDPVALWVRDLVPGYIKTPALRAAWVRAASRGARDRGVYLRPYGGHENDEQAALLWEAERDAGLWVSAHGLWPFPGMENLVHVESPTRLIHKRDLAEFIAGRED